MWDGQVVDQSMSDTPGSERDSRLAAEFERHRTYLRSIAYRMLGSMSEADDAVQETWLRLDRRPPESAEQLRPWLTTVVSRICLDALRARRRRLGSYAGAWLPEPLVTTTATDTASISPESQVELADSVGLALLVVLETLNPAERLAFVLHDVFGLSFEEIAPMVDRTPGAARQLASRARRRVHARPSGSDSDRRVDRRIADAFLAAARAGDFGALLTLLDPDVVLNTDGGGSGPLARPSVGGAERVAEVIRGRAPLLASLCRYATVNGGPGFIVGNPGHALAVVALTVHGGRIHEVDIIGDPAKLRAARLR